MSTLKQQIEELNSITLSPPPDFNEWVEKKKVLEEVADYVCISRGHLPSAITRLKDDLVMFFRDHNLPSILNENLNEVVDEWTKRELLGDLK